MTLRLALVLVALLALPATARAADPAFDVAVSSQSVAPGDRVVHTVTIRTGDEAEKFKLLFRGRSAGVIAGHSTLTLISPTFDGTYSGPGHAVFGPYAVPSPLPPCSKVGFGQRSSWANDVPVSLELPANSTSTVRLPANASRLIPRPGEQYVVSIEALNDEYSGGTLTAPGPLTVPPLQVADGPRGVWLTAATDPPSLALRHGGDPSCGSALPVVRDRGITVTGQADPALPGQQLVLQAGMRGGSGIQDVATTTVGGDGSFSFGPWAPPAVGDYEIRVAYRSQQPEYADDAMDHALGFRYEISPPVPETAAVVARRARVRRGIARVRARCPASAARSCAGTIHLLHRGRKVGTRAFSVAPGRTATVRVRLNRRGRALSRRLPHMTVRVALR